jgi:hypothetical protein
MTRKELKQLIRETIEDVGMDDAMAKWNASKDTAMQNSNIEAQKLIGKTIKAIKVNPKTGDLDIEFTNGQKVVYGEMDGIYSFEEN